MKYLTTAKHWHQGTWTALLPFGAERDPVPPGLLSHLPVHLSPSSAPTAGYLLLVRQAAVQLSRAQGNEELSCRGDASRPSPPARQTLLARHTVPPEKYPQEPGLAG